MTPDLDAIEARCDVADIPALLAEVRRLQAVVARVWNLAHAWSDPDGADYSRKVLNGASVELLRALDGGESDE